MNNSSIRNKNLEDNERDMPLIRMFENTVLSEEDTNFEASCIENPRLWALKKKICVTIFVLLTAFTATLGTPIYVGAIPYLQIKFKLTTTDAVLPCSLYALAIGSGALLTSGFSEIYGRRIVYQLTLPGALLSSALASISTKFFYLVLFRIFAGIFSAPSLTIGVGVLNDMWDPTLDSQATFAALLFVLVVIWATRIGPIASISLIEISRHWQWAFYIFSLMLVACVFFSIFNPETYAPRILRQRSSRRGRPVQCRDNSWRIIREAISRPIHMLFVEPILFPTGLVLAVTQSVIFSYYIAYASIFEGVYGFTQLQVAITFVPLAIGSLFAVPVVVLCDKYLYQKLPRAVREQGSIKSPEDRLYPAMVSSFTMPISLFW
ncbi:putative transporter [Golovinomyces cichoracearum]|uniref:Putative transporter n=1 Tax=Golovinomyces cichoracearum TaxID=62708 RepID=A0A420J8F0_9PEZI|nr:putative transporter [Golovinomyces cichoracearum]